MFSICGKLKKLQPISHDSLIDRFNRIVGDRFHVEQKGSILTLTGSISSWRFRFTEERLTHLIAVSGTYEIIYLTNYDTPCPICEKLDGYGVLFKQQAAEYSVKKHTKRDLRMLAIQGRIDQAIRENERNGKSKN